MLWISHRGESCDAPENTMKAFRLAWERDTDGIELDIRISSDRRVVCMNWDYYHVLEFLHHLRHLRL